MHTSIDEIIDRQFGRWELERGSTGRQGVAAGPPLGQPVITVSRQHGSNGALIAGHLAERFHYTLLHRDVINRMCESTGYKRRLLESLDERSQSELQRWIDSMVSGQFVDTTDYVVALFKTIYSVARLGGVVVVGRGGNFIVGPAQGFHARIVAPIDDRVRNLMKRKQLAEKDAAREIEARDRERVEFVRKLFGRSVDDPSAYDMVVNEEHLSMSEIVGVMATAAAHKFERLRTRAAAAAG